jgi:hypothetical protein
MEEEMMGKKLAISVFIVALGSASSVIMAAATQSLHFRSAAPAEAAAGGDDLRTAVKANGLPPIGSGSIDLVAMESSESVTNKAARAQCQAAFATPGVMCTVIELGTFTTCTTGPACCEMFMTFTVDIVNASCNKGPGTPGFVLQRVPQDPLSPDPEHPGRKVTAIASGGGSVSNYSAENKNVYRDIGQDPAARTLIQVRPGGVTGTITINIYHNQGGQNPRTATVTVTSANNDPSESLALHNAIETALETISPALPAPIDATTRARVDATSPLTAFGWLKQADHFTEITNMQAAAITEVRVIVPAGAGMTVEGTDNLTDMVGAGVPTLNEWGIVVLVVLLLLSGYVLMRRQRSGTATA